MTYRVVNVAGEPPGSAGRVGPGRYVCVDGSRLKPGRYATVVIELPPSQAQNGSPLVRGYYAVFWPMDPGSPDDDARPQYFGPYRSRRNADALIFELSGGKTFAHPASGAEPGAQRGQLPRQPTPSCAAPNSGGESGPGSSA